MRESISAGHLIIMPELHIVMCNDTRTVELSRLEFDLLYFLAQHPRQVFSKKQLLDNVWGSYNFEDTNTVRTYISRLRSKLGDPATSKKLIQSVRGIGYRLVP